MPSIEQNPALDSMRATLRGMGLPFQEADGTLFSRIAIENLEVHMICWGSTNDLAQVVVRLPLRAASDTRLAVGEFLHRLNFNERRKLWELNCDTGEIRLASFIDTLAAPLIEEHFRVLVESLLASADAAFPHLVSVLTGRMTAEGGVQPAACGWREWAGGLKHRNT